MRMTSVLAGAAVAFTIAVAATPGQAAPAVPQLDAAKLAQTVADYDGPRRHHHWHHNQWRQNHWRHDGWRPRHFGRCSAWRNECAARWGWGGWRFQRCIARHGC